MDHLVSGGSDGSSGLNSLWMTNISSLFARSIQCLSLNFMVMLSSMNPFTDASVAVLSTAKGSFVARLLAGCCLSPCKSKYRCGGFR